MIIITTSAVAVEHVHSAIGSKSIRLFHSRATGELAPYGDVALMIITVRISKALCIYLFEKYLNSSLPITNRKEKEDEENNSNCGNNDIICFNCFCYR